MAVEPEKISTEDYNSRVSEWGYNVAQQLKASIGLLLSKGKGDLLKSLRTKTKKDFGEIDRITYGFQRHGVFAHKGVGRGYKMIGGKVMRVSGSEGAAFVAAYAKIKNREHTTKVLTVAAIKRQPVEWFNPIINENIDELANMVTSMRADQAVNATKIMIR